MDSPKSTPLASVAPVAAWSSSDAANAKVVLSGKVDVYSLGLLWAQIRNTQNDWLAQGAANSKTLTFDASNVGSLDGAGIAFLIDLQEVQQKAGGTFTLVGLDARYQPLLKEFDPIGNLFPFSSVKN
jgi:phospholipid/cholesterol/gamma-HCH transport system permease protein